MQILTLIKLSVSNNFLMFEFCKENPLAQWWHVASGLQPQYAQTQVTDATLSLSVLYMT